MCGATHNQTGPRGEAPSAGRCSPAAPAVLAVLMLLVVSGEAFAGSTAGAPRGAVAERLDVRALSGSLARAVRQLVSPSHARSALCWGPAVHLPRTRDAARPADGQGILPPPMPVRAALLNLPPPTA